MNNNDRIRRFKRWLVIGASICYAAAIALSVVGEFQHLPNVANTAIPAIFLGALFTGIILGLSITIEEIKSEKHE